MRFFVALFILACLTYALTGCATAPTRTGTLPIYTIAGTRYVNLISLCEQSNIRWQYDPYSRLYTLTAGSHKLVLWEGSRLVMVDAETKALAHPVQRHQGMVVVPYSFREDTLASLLAETAYCPALPSLALPGIKRIVVDAGHGGTDPGAIGKTGVKEKSVTLDVAKRLAAELRQQGVEVVMTRTSDKAVSLAERAAVANTSRADLFISVHANANRVRRLNGFEVYYISPAVSDIKRALAAAEHGDLNGMRSSYLSPTKNLRAIVWDLLHTQNRRESIELARSICSSIDCTLQTKVLGVKSANFSVLRTTRMPAVLVEIGFLSNREEEQLLQTDAYRQKIVESLMRGIAAYAQDHALLAKGEN